MSLWPRAKIKRYWLQTQMSTSIKHDTKHLLPLSFSLPCLPLSSVHGQLQIRRVQPPGPVLPWPVPGRLFRAGERQQLRGLQEPPARGRLCGKVSSRILRLQGLALCQLLFLSGWLQIFKVNPHHISTNACDTLISNEMVYHLTHYYPALKVI